MFDLSHYLKTKQAVVDERLAALLDRERQAPAALVEAMRYSLLAPGKRLRPILVLMAAHAAGGAESDALPAGCAVEMIHTYSLIHDDLPAMDDDDLRRGRATCHKKFGEALAILAGDALLTLAFQVLGEHYPPAIAGPGCFELARCSGMSGMVGGQVEDLAWERGAGENPAFPRSDAPHSLEALERIHDRKTGALFRACLKLGVWAAQSSRHTPCAVAARDAAGGSLQAHASDGTRSGPAPLSDSDLVARLDAFARCLGLVFQITDDLLDVEQSAEQLGKRTQKDAARGKLTYPSFLGVEASRRRAQELADEAAAALGPLGPRGLPLAALIDYVLKRDR